MKIELTKSDFIILSILCETIKATKEDVGFMKRCWQNDWWKFDIEELCEEMMFHYN